MKKKGIVAFDILEKQANTALNTQNYKTAIKLYKQLLETSNNAAYRTDLSFAYISQAFFMARKGKLKEAVVLWEAHCPYKDIPYFFYCEYIVWLILTKNKKKLKEHKLSAETLDKNETKLAEILGLLLIVNSPNVIPEIAVESLFIKHFERVKKIVLAYEHHEQAALAALLKQIPYRSAFRYFRQIVTALVVLPDSVTQARALLAKVEDSIYTSAAQLFLVSTFDGAELIEKLANISRKHRDVIYTIKGFNKEQLKFSEYLIRQRKKLSNKGRFKAAIHYRNLCGDDVAKRYCQQALANEPLLDKEFVRIFGALDEYEHNRIKALSYERENSMYEAETCWRRCIKLLELQNKAENALKIALILRHLSKYEPPPEENRLLIESLEYDAEDDACYVSILNYYQQEAGFAKEYKHWLKISLEKYPQDVPILTHAVQEATRNKTYKKACQYATKILKIDPLNTFAKHILFSSHLAHARRSLRAKSYHLVAKEIKLAKKINIGKVYARYVQLIDALLIFAQEDKQQGLTMIAKILAELYINPVNMHFHASVEATAVGLPVATVLRVLPPIKDSVLSEADFIQFMKVLDIFITASASDGHEIVHKGLLKVKGSLKKTLSKQNFSEVHLLNFCKILEGIKSLELLHYCAKLGFSQWETPIWMYYYMYAKYEGKSAQCTDNEFERLNYYYEQAIENKDFVTYTLLEKLLARHSDTQHKKKTEFISSEEEVDHRGILFGHVPEKIMDRINRLIDSIYHEQDFDTIFKIIMTEVDSKEALFTIMNNEYIASSIMIVKIAKQEGIDLGVTIDDIFKCYGMSR